MKQFSILFFTFFSLTLFSQESEAINYQIKVSSLSYSVNSIDELKKIDLNEIKDIFENNKRKDTVQLTFELDIKEPKFKTKSSVKVVGLSHQMDSLIINCKKAIKALINLSENNHKKK